MKRVSVAALVLAAALTAPAASVAAPVLFEVAFNVDGTGFSSLAGAQPDLLSAGSGSPFDVSAFDFGSGLGTIQLTIAGTGLHSVAGFFDLELTGPNSSAFDDEAEALGAPAAGQRWEIDEPGFSFGDIYGNVFGGVLENANNLVAPEDVSMAMSWDFVLAADEFAVLTFSTAISDGGGFRLRHFDATGESVFLSSNLRIAQRPVPEPFLALLAGAAISAGAARARRGRRG